MYLDIQFCLQTNLPFQQVEVLILLQTKYSRTVIKELIVEGIYLSGVEIDTLLIAIKYYGSREGSFSKADPLVPISETLKNRKNGIKTSILNESELSVILQVINENIDYLNKYDYVGLPNETKINNKYKY